MQIGLHKLEHQVHVLVILRAEGLLQLHDILVVELLQEHDLAVGPLGVGCVLERVEDFL
jgi:hypothetical protein